LRPPKTGAYGVFFVEGLPSKSSSFGFVQIFKVICPEIGKAYTSSTSWWIDVVKTFSCFSSLHLDVCPLKLEQLKLEFDLGGISVFHPQTVVNF